MKQKRLLVGISGASGMPIAVELLRALKVSQTEVHLICTDSAVKTLSLETDNPINEIQSLADAVYDSHNIGAAPASGSFPMDGMAVVPCLSLIHI